MTYVEYLQMTAEFLQSPMSQIQMGYGVKLLNMAQALIGASTDPEVLAWKERIQEAQTDKFKQALQLINDLMALDFLTGQRALAMTRKEFEQFMELANKTLESFPAENAAGQFHTKMFQYAAPQLMLIHSQEIHTQMDQQLRDFKERIVSKYMAQNQQPDPKIVAAKEELKHMEKEVDELAKNKQA